ncbi:hypothetical protein BDZ89DRAFT_1068387 [Hymenopellis radicata]|nr:hypothetical protein BDZ89DRAFT_1068387 [Hymenopellis radicata]
MSDYNDDSEYTVACTPIDEFRRVSIHSGDELDDDGYLDRSRMMVEALQEAASAAKHESHLIDELRVTPLVDPLLPPKRGQPALAILQLDKDRARAIADDLAIERSFHRARVDELRASNLDLERAISDVQTAMQLLARAKVAETRDLAVRLDQVHDHLRVVWGMFYKVFVAVAENCDKAKEQRVYVLEGERLLEEISVRKGKALRDYEAAKWWKDQEEQYARKHAEVTGGHTMFIQKTEQNIRALQEKLRAGRVGRKVNQRTKDLLEKREQEVGEREKAVKERMDAPLEVALIVPSAKARALEERIRDMDTAAEDLNADIAGLRLQLGPRLVLEQRRQELLATLSAELLEAPKVRERYVELKEELKEKTEELEEWGEMFRHNQAEYKRASFDLRFLDAECRRVQNRIEGMKAHKDRVERRTVVVVDAVAAATSTNKPKKRGQVEKRDLALAAMLKDKQRAVEDARRELEKAREEEERVRGAVIKEGREAKERILGLRKEVAGLKVRVEQVRRKVNVLEARSGVREEGDDV